MKINGQTSNEAIKMTPGTKFRAIRKSTGSPALKGILNPLGRILTCVDDYDDIIICKEKTCPYRTEPRPYNIFRRFWDIEESESE